MRGVNRGVQVVPALSVFVSSSSSQDKVYQFCSKTCCEDYKKLHCIVTFCEYCQEEKTLHETVKFSGVKRPFCSEGRPCFPPRHLWWCPVVQGRLVEFEMGGLEVVHFHACFPRCKSIQV